MAIENINDIPVVEATMSNATYVGAGGSMGPQGPQGEKGDKGDPFTYEDFTEEQLANLVGPPGLTGPQGPKGDPFTYSDFTEEQLAALKGEKGDAFTFADLTPAQIQVLKGPKGDTGDAFTYADFTQEQLAALKGPKGDQGVQGIQGPKGDDGDERVYVGSSQPTDPDIDIWIDTTGTTPDISNYYTKTQIDNKGYLTQHQSLSDYYTKTEVDNKGYLTQHQSLSGLATETWVGQQGYLTQHQDISGKANSADLATVATSGDYDDLINKPSAYSLPTASTSTLGGVKVDGSTITIDNNGVISGSSGGSTYTAGDNVTITNDTINVRIVPRVISINQNTTAANMNADNKAYLNNTFVNGYESYPCIIKAGISYGQKGYYYYYMTDTDSDLLVFVGMSFNPSDTSYGGFQFLFMKFTNNVLSQITWDQYGTGTSRLPAEGIRLPATQSPSGSNTTVGAAMEYIKNNYAKKSELPDALPTSSSTDGAYMLVDTVSSGVSTKTWETVPSGGGSSSPKIITIKYTSNDYGSSYGDGVVEAEDQTYLKNLWSQLYNKQLTQPPNVIIVAEAYNGQSLAYKNYFNYVSYEQGYGQQALFFLGGMRNGGYFGLAQLKISCNDTHFWRAYCPFDYNGFIDTATLKAQYNGTDCSLYDFIYNVDNNMATKYSVPTAYTNKMNTQINTKVLNCDTTTDGTYQLQCVVSNGEPTYSWVAVSS